MKQDAIEAILSEILETKKDFEQNTSFILTAFEKYRMNLRELENSIKYIETKNPDIDPKKLIDALNEKLIRIAEEQQSYLGR